MKLSSKYIVILLIGLLFGCSKEKGAPEPVKLTPFEFKVSTIEEGVGYNYAEISWNASEIEDESTILYDVYLGEELKGKSIKDLKYRFDNLKPNTKYDVKVVAKSIYKTEFPVNYSFFTSEAPAPKAVVIKEGNKSPESIVISWSVEDGVGSLKYDVYLNGAKVVEQQEGLSYTFENLKGNTNYSVKVVAVNSFNKTSEAVVDIKTPDYNLPSDFEVIANTILADKVIVGWIKRDDLSYSVYLDGVLKKENLEVGSFEFNGLTEKTEYTIKVVAVNAHGKSLAKEVKVETREADAPMDFDLRISNITENKAEVRCYDIFGNDKKGAEYKIYLNGVLKTTKQSSGTYLLEGLEQGTEYTVKVVVVNKFNKELAKTVKFKTVEIITLSDFTVKAKDISATGATLEWTPSVSSDGSQVEYSIYAENGTTIKSRLTSTKFVFDYSLTPNKEHTFKIVARNLTGQSKEATVTFTTLAHAKPSDFDVTVSEVGETSALVSWTKSVLADGGEVTYSVSRNGIGVLSRSKENRFKLERLTPNTDYKVKVVAESNHGVRTEKEISFKTDAEKTLTLEVVENKPRSLSLHWDVEGAEIEDYSFFCNGELKYHGTDNNYLLQNLESNKEYTLKVKAKRKNSYTIYEKVLKVSTKAYPQITEGVVEVNSINGAYNDQELNFTDLIEKNKAEFPEIYSLKVVYHSNSGRTESVLKEKMPFNSYVSPDKDYQCTVQIYHTDGTKLYDKVISYRSLPNKAPSWNAPLRVLNTGFSYVELENNFAKDFEPGLEIKSYSYFVNGRDITNVYTTVRGNGQMKRRANTSGDPIVINALEANKEYEFYMVAVDKDGARTESSRVTFRTSSTDVRNPFVITSEESKPGIFTISCDQMGPLSSIKEVRAEFMLNALAPVDRHIGYRSVVRQENGKFKIDIDFSKRLQDNPNLLIHMKLKYNFIDNESINEIESEFIKIHE
ncbi:MAG: fibronectin type III domain-containing protein [Prolixibacteraceae bacterium]|jgi:hypothetical protein|nr:fibronectin type III domain-containing protein [Prolixibacteraceae bacterium]